MPLPIIPGPNNELITQSQAIPPQYKISASYSDTASYAFFALTSSYQIVSMSYVQSASYTLSGSYSQTASYALSASYAPSSGTASYALNVPTKLWGSWYSTLTQTASLTNTAYPVSVNTLVGANGFYISGSNNISGSAMVVPKTAVYDFQFSLQLHNTGGGGQASAVNIWLKVNGNNVSYSNTQVSVNANSPYVVSAWDFMGTYNAGDKIELYWSTNNTNTQIEAAPASAPAPEIPSVIFTIMEL